MLIYMSIQNTCIYNQPFLFHRQFPTTNLYSERRKTRGKFVDTHFPVFTNWISEKGRVIYTSCVVCPFYSAWRYHYKCHMFIYSLLNKSVVVWIKNKTWLLNKHTILNSKWNEVNLGPWNRSFGILGLNSKNSHILSAGSCGVLL